MKYEDATEGGGGGEEEERKVFQMVLTTSSLVTMTQRFRLGQPFTKQDYDGTPSKVNPMQLLESIPSAFLTQDSTNTFLYLFFWLALE